MNTTLHTTPQITEFAQKVREHLADLPADEIDELTEGLEADLAEALAEDLKRELPDPAAYALELRNAAGLPPGEQRTRAGVGQAARGVAESLRLKGESLIANIRQSPIGAGVLDLLVELRPAWWILRAWVAYQIACAVFGLDGQILPMNLSRWMLLGAFALVSVQWGRHRWLPEKGLGGLILLGNVIAAIALLPSLEHAYDWADRAVGTEYVSDTTPVAKGLSFDGHLLENIYVYDANGKPLHDVQLFDVDGKPLETSRNNIDESPMQPSPVKLETGALAYNVFPLSLTKMMWDENGDVVPEPTPDADKTKAFANGPFLKVPAVMTSPDADKKSADKKVDKGNG